MQRAHPRAGAAAKGVAELEALEAIAALGLLPNHVEHTVDELGALGIMALGPIISCTCLSKHEVVRPEELPEGARTDGVHGPRLEVHEHGPWDVPAARGLVVVHIDAFELEVAI